jgi:hypothetical protein
MQGRDSDQVLDVQIRIRLEGSEFDQIRNTEMFFRESYCKVPNMLVLLKDF